jgi:predicted extracellular nuclease
MSVVRDLVQSDPAMGPFVSQQDHREESVRTYHIAWWNLENLFDEENAVALGRRTDKVFRAIKNDIAGWTPQLRDRKIEQLASVIAGMNNGNGPDLLGVCEVENRFVVDRLVDTVNATLPAPRNYEVVHADTDDARGIDVAFIYDQTLFQVPLPLQESVFFHVVMRRHRPARSFRSISKPQRRPPGPGPSR